MEFLIFLMLIECVAFNIKPVYSTEIGATCISHWDCESKTVDNLICESSVCVCDTGYRPVGTLCEAVLDGNCTVNSDCYTYLSTSVCTNNTCSCTTGYKPDNILCTEVLGSACTATADCDVTNSICSNNVCACAPGYREGFTSCVQVLGESCKAESACTTY
ncbi:prion-like-(Q/N-rich) domain-bearing protein 25 [Ruditapes philippinarum]|uniref:prion-like-(Q/N-rich) domain-bearing protein 25 n=1 Tax=Ruditapes philippinarum TaxID=129788 RepID=UPI00295B9875|nr:prion-like-(Q/N-rich) domain-bearing protein 25 [Ruditapes philippinarum]